MGDASQPPLVERSATGVESAAGAAPVTRWMRAVFLAPRGDGATRRRASDAFRFAFAAAAVAVSIPVMRSNSAAELAIAHAVNPPPEAIRWLVTSLFWLGSVGVVVLLAALGLLVPRWTAIRWIVVAALVTWGVCALLGTVLGPAAGRPVTSAVAGFDTSYPVTGLAVAIAAAATALPYLSRPCNRLVSTLVTLAALAAVVGGSALPVNALSSLLLGWGVAAALHLIFGSPLGLRSAQEVAEIVAERGITVQDLAVAPHQSWGVERLTGCDAAGQPVELSVYGRDASDARAVAKLWRFCFYRDSGPALILDRLQQVEHEAYLMLMTGRAGVLVPQVLAVGRFGPSGDAALVTGVPEGPHLAQADPAGLSDGVLDEVLHTVLCMRRAGIAHGTLGAETIIFSAGGVCIRDFRCASASAPAERLDGDLAAVLGALAVRVGVGRTAAAASRVLDTEATRRALVRLQRSALDPVTVAAVARDKTLLPRLRSALASTKGIEVPKLDEPKRISWVNLAFGLGMLIGVWAIIGVLSGVGGALEAIKGAQWGWVALAFVLAQLPMVAEGWAVVGSVTGQLPFGRCVALEISNSFTSLVAGDVGVFAVRVRFFQRQGYDAETAISSGTIATAGSWLAKGLLFLIALGFAAGDFHPPQSANGDQTTIWVVVGVVLAAGIAVALVTLIPRLRRLASARVRPHLVNIWANLKVIATTPRKIFYVLAGSVLAQLLVAFALGASLHAVGQQASLAVILVVMTSASIIGSAVPVPGGAGVVEAGLIAGLTSAGVPENQAVAAVLIQRLCTAYLPPVWGWLTLAWMRRREYV
jgi:glycosyltransferase 2 family protein